MNIVILQHKFLILLQTCRNLSFTKDSYVPENKGNSTAQRALFNTASSSTSHSNDVDLNSLNLSHWFSPNHSSLCTSENSARLSGFMNESDEMESMGRMNMEDTTGKVCGMRIHMLARLGAVCHGEFVLYCFNSYFVPFYYGIRNCDNKDLVIFIVFNFCWFTLCEDFFFFYWECTKTILFLFSSTVVYFMGYSFYTHFNSYPLFWFRMLHLF